MFTLYVGDNGGESSLWLYCMLVTSVCSLQNETMVKPSFTSVSWKTRGSLLTALTNTVVDTQHFSHRRSFCKVHCKKSAAKQRFTRLTPLLVLRESINDNQYYDDEVVWWSSFLKHLRPEPESGSASDVMEFWDTDDNGWPSTSLS